MGKRGPRSVKRFGLTARIQIRILWEGFGRVAAGEKKATGQSKVAGRGSAKVEQGRASGQATRAGAERGERREERVEGHITSGTADVIFIPGPGRGQRGHQRTGDE